MKPRVPQGKTMRVATAFTGMTACAGVFLPTAAAHATPSSAGRAGNLAKVQTQEGKLVRLKVSQGGRTTHPGITGGNPAKSSSGYWLDIQFKTSVTTYQVCGLHIHGAYRCTAVTRTSHGTSLSKFAFHVGGNKHSWILGPISVFWNGGGPGHRDYCNTTGHWHGQWLVPGVSDNGLASARSAVLSGPGLIGNGVPEC